MVGRRSTDAELNTILLDTLAVSKLRAYQTLYQQYCNRSSTGITYEDLYNNIHDLVKYDGDGIKSITARDSDMDDSDGSRITKESSRSSNSHSSRRNQQIAAAANYIAQQQVGVNTAANANIRYQEQSPGKSGGHLSSPGQGTQPPCKNCKSTKHATKWCTSTKCYNPTAASRSRTPQSAKPTTCANMDSINRMTSKHRQGRSHRSRKANPSRELNSPRYGQVENDDSCIDSEVSSDSSMSVDRPPKSIVWKDRPKSRKVSKIQTVSTIHRTTKVDKDTTGIGIPQANDGDTEAAAEGEQAQPEPTYQAQAVPSSEPARRRLR